MKPLLLRALAGCGSLALLFAVAAPPVLAQTGAARERGKTATPRAPTTLPPAGQLLFASGDAQLVRGTAPQPARHGLALRESDVLTTGEDGKLQLRLTDGAMVALAPQSRVQLAPAQVEGVAIQFDAGSVRVAGLKTAGAPLAPNRPLTQLRTERVTANVRGASFSASYNGDGTVNVATERDPLQVCTNAGCVELDDAGSVRIRSDTQPPTRTNARPTFR